jgi:hypothetical protein
MLFGLLLIGIDVLFRWRLSERLLSFRLASFSFLGLMAGFDEPTLAEMK